jgi:hypothetical protein
VSSIGILGHRKSWRNRKVRRRTPTRKTITIHLCIGVGRRRRRMVIKTLILVASALSSFSNHALLVLRQAGPWLCVLLLVLPRLCGLRGWLTSDFARGRWRLGHREARAIVGEIVRVGLIMTKGRRSVRKLLEI